MKSTFIWLGVLAGSVGLGVGMYTVVVAPGTSGMNVSGMTAAPEPRPTVMKYKTKIVKDPPKTKVVDVPVAAAAAGGGQAASSSVGGGQERAWSGGRSSGGDDDNERIVYSDPEPENEGNRESQDDGDDSYRQESDDEGENEAAQEAAEDQREAAKDAAEDQREAAKDAAEDEGGDEREDD